MGVEVQEHLSRTLLICQTNETRYWWNCRQLKDIKTIELTMVGAEHQADFQTAVVLGYYKNHLES